MSSYLVRRALLAIPTFIGITLLAFALIRLVPGDPVQLMAGERRLDPEAHAEMRRQLGLDRPLAEQYFSYLQNAVQLDLGRSLVSGEPVWAEFAARFPATLELAACALLVAGVLGVAAGIAAAVRRGSWVDRSVMAASITGFSMPIFWWGLLLIMFFSVRMRELAPALALALPVSGRIGLEYDIAPRTGWLLVDSWLSGEPGAWRSALAHLVLPTVVLATVPLAVIARMTRSALLEVLREDFVRAARARGLSPARVVVVHALRNALLPVATVLGLQVGALLGGAVLTETIFSWPGIGKWLIDAIGRRDYPVVQGGILISATLVIAVNLAVDLLYLAIDPRMRRGG